MFQISAYIGLLFFLQVITDQNNSADQGEFYAYVHELIKRLI